MVLSRREAIDFLHNDKHYSRRLSAKLVDLAMKDNEGAMAEALRKCLESGVKKKKIKFKYIIKK